MSYLTDSSAELWDAVIAGLEGEGFAYDPLYTTHDEYLATALGQPSAYLTKSSARMLSELISAYGGGDYSQFRTPFNQLLELLGTALSGGSAESESRITDDGELRITDEDEERVTDP